MDLFPVFWTWIGDQMKNGNIYSSHLVYEEIKNGEDELAEWIKEIHDSTIFPIPNKGVQTEYTAIINDISSKYFPSELGYFLKGADPFILAQAKHDQSIIVTSEKPVPTNSKKIKIPNLCKKLEIDYCDTFSMMRKLKASF